jgi:gluconate 2-dehydrogenase gamma chain
MNRREALRQVAWLMGGAISAPAVLGVLKGCSARQGIDWKPVFFSEEQGALVAEVAEIIIPRTDTPGAKDVGVPAFIDVMLKEVYPKKDQDRFIAGLKVFDDEAKRLHDKPFMKLATDERLELVRRLHESAAAEERDMTVPPAQLERPFILMVRELTLLGFFTSQDGATKVLQHVTVPGAFQACVPLDQAGNGKTWAGDAQLRF